MSARPRAETARCPTCGRRSRRVHSRYTRRVADLPIAGRPVILSLYVRRFRCANRRCSRVTFAEQLGGLVARSARRTDLLRSALEQIGLVVGARPGQRLATRLGLQGSHRTLLRLVRALPEPPGASARVLGVDEFAVRRGRVYGTVLVDVERRRPVDLLDDRSAEQFAGWLDQRPLPEVVCRDRAGCYAEGARRSAPRAVQVADRWHLLANLTDAVERVARQHLRCGRTDPLTVPLVEDLPEPQAPIGGILARHRERHRQVQALLARGLTITAISTTLHLDRKTVRKFARVTSAEAVGTWQLRPTSALMAPFIASIDARWREGCTDGTRLYAEVQAQGYRGSRRTFQRYLALLRRAAPVRQPQPTPSPRAIAALIVRRPERLDAAEQAELDHLCAACPELATTRRLAQAFAALVRERPGEAVFRAWLAEATASRIPGVVSFAAGLRHDAAAVVAGLTLPWSSGAVEGHNTRIKLIKRQMYGRGRFDLLKRRVLLTR